jgi:site-specific DNA-methyltransferase (adenine-specific)
MIQLINNDCLAAMKDIPNGSVDLILQDPPYNSTQCTWEWDLMDKIEDFWKEWKRIIKPNGAIVMTASQPFTSKLIVSNLKMFKYCWVWEKHHTGQLNAKKQPLRNVEDVVVFYAKQCTYNPQFVEGDPYTVVRTGYKGSEAYGKQRDHTTVSDGKRYPKQILKFKENMTYHPTQKPVALMEYLIKTYTNEGETVFDGFAGSGTTGVAAKNTNRSFIGAELNETYFNIAKERIEKQ